MVQLSNPYVTTGKDIVLTIQTFVGKVMSLLFNKLSRFIINEYHGIWSHHFMANRWENNGNSEKAPNFILGVPKSLQMLTAAMKLKDACSLEEKL